ncbi:DUF1700 domain-containing protein [Viridibacillus sp. YIM B01967]|uniref:DUF1700 domain-containing protein n=1 Tax=Viridibacillus soli TaxID=2798301 RepID=A0ABS1H2L1_9BACL|nr:DUF1700 domain-containing protein [Viridibacillus soli]MBK3493643.1 DUF1700 domain-containing protein [Viridibacillus soli]
MIAVLGSFFIGFDDFMLQFFVSIITCAIGLLVSVAMIYVGEFYYAIILSYIKFNVKVINGGVKMKKMVVGAFILLFIGIVGVASTLYFTKGSLFKLTEWEEKKPVSGQEIQQLEINSASVEQIDDMDIETTSGEVQIKAKQSIPFAIDYKGGSGDGIISASGVTYTEKSEHLLVGEIGSGKTKLKVRTSSGDFILR